MVHKRLLTKDRLIECRVSNVDNACVLCPNGVESHIHLFFACAYSRGVLHEVCEQFGLVNFPVTWSAWSRWLIHLKCSSALCVKVWKAVIAGVVYALWREHNRRLFAQGSRSGGSLVQEVSGVVRSRISCLVNMV